MTFAGTDRLAEPATFQAGTCLLSTDPEPDRALFLYTISVGEQEWSGALRCRGTCADLAAPTAPNCSSSPNLPSSPAALPSPAPASPPPSSPEPTPPPGDNGIELLCAAIRKLRAALSLHVHAHAGALDVRTLPHAENMATLSCAECTMQSESNVFYTFPTKAIYKTLKELSGVESGAVGLRKSWQLLSEENSWPVVTAPGVHSGLPRTACSTQVQVGGHAYPGGHWLHAESNCCQACQSQASNGCNMWSYCYKDASRSSLCSTVLRAHAGQGTVGVAVTVADAGHMRLHAWPLKAGLVCSSCMQLRLNILGQLRAHKDHAVQGPYRPRLLHAFLD